MIDLIHYIEVVPQIGGRDSTQILSKYINERLKKREGIKRIHYILSAAISFKDIKTHNRRSQGT